MKRKAKGLVTTLGSAFVAVVVFAQVSDQEGLMFCSCPEDTVFDHALPMSHPVNRCATEQQSSVSWSSWFSGQSSTNQFHYLDLLELLSRASDESDPQSPQSK